jgi:hypothetical protein
MFLFGSRIFPLVVVPIPACVLLAVDENRGDSFVIVVLSESESNVLLLVGGCCHFPLWRHNDILRVADRGDYALSARPPGVI